MTHFTALSTTNTLGSKRKAARWLQEKEYDTLFLDFPKDMEGFIKDIALGASSEHIIKQIKDLGLIKDKEEKHLYTVTRPILEVVHGLTGSNVEVFCYIEPISYSFSYEVANEVAKLLVKAKNDDFDPKVWKDLLREQAQLEINCAEREAGYITKRAKDENIILDAPREIKTFIRKQGHDVEEVVIDRSFKPLDNLCDMIKDEILIGKKVSDYQIKHLIMDHAKFSRLILDKDVEQAYKIWKESHTHVHW